MIAVSIVSYNTSGLLKKLLENLYSQKKVEISEIWVVDNNSSDDSVKMIQKDFPKVKLIQSKENLGFAKGQNLALKKIKAPLTLILNPDTNFSFDVLNNMEQFMDNNPALGVASCKILGGSGEIVSNGGDLPFGFALVSWLFNFDFKGMPSFHRSDKEFLKTKNAGWVGGTFMWARKEVFDRAGFFNEDYFMYFEDVEFCYRARRKGFKIGLNPEVTITHLSGASSDNPRLAQWRGEMQGLIRFSYSSFSPLYGLIISLLVRLALILRIIAFAVLGKLDYSGIYLKVLTSL
jgi:GT2 family glycosyltransferase